VPTLLTLHAAKDWSSAWSSSSAWTTEFFRTAVRSTSRNRWKRSAVSFMWHHARQGQALPDPRHPARRARCSRRDISIALPGRCAWRSAGREDAHRSLHPGRVPDTQCRFPPSPGSPIRESKYRPGLTSATRSGARGIVSTAACRTDDEIVDVVFESVGIKRLAASLANLIVIK